MSIGGRHDAAFKREHGLSHPITPPTPVVLSTSVPATAWQEGVGTFNATDPIARHTAGPIRETARRYRRWARGISPAPLLCQIYSDREGMWGSSVAARWAPLHLLKLGVMGDGTGRRRIFNPCNIKLQSHDGCFPFMAHGNSCPHFGHAEPPPTG